MLKLSEKTKKLIQEGKAEFIGQLDASEDLGCKAYYRIDNDGKTYYVYGFVAKETSENNQTPVLQD